MTAGERTVRIKFDGTTKGLAAARAAAREELRAVSRAVAEENRKIEASQRQAAAQEKATMQATQKAAADHERAMAALRKESEAQAKKLAGERTKRFTKWRNELTSMAKSVLSLSTSALSNLAALNSGVGVLVGLVSWAGAASGALGLIPGALAAGAAGMITWKLGADGIKKAFEGTTPVLDRLKAAVSGTFRTELAPAVRDINALLPLTTGHFQRIAGAISETITRFTAMARQKSNTQALNSTLDSSAGIIRNVGKALAPLGQAFLDLAQVGSRSVEKLTGGVGGLAQRFADFIRQAKDSGKIDQWIQGGLDAFKDLFGVLRDVWDIVKSVFGAVREGGAGVAPVLSPAIATIKEFVQSPQGQETFRTLGEVLSKVGDAVSRVLGPALKAVSPLIEPLGDLLGTVAGILADNLGPALEDLGNILAPVVRALSPVVEQLVKGLAPIIPVIVRALGPFAALLIMLAPVIMVLNIPIMLLISALTALVQLMTGDVVGAGKTMAAGWQNATDTMKTVTETNWGGMATDVLDAMNGIGESVATKGSNARADWGGALLGMQGDTSSAMGGMVGKISAGMGQAAGIAAMGGQNASGQFGSAIMGMPRGADQGTSGVLGILRGFIGRIPQAMGDVGSLLFESGKALLQGLARGVDAATGGLLSKIGNVVRKVRDFFPFSPAKTGPFSGRGWVLYSGMSIAEQFGEGVLSRASAAVAAVRGMTGQMATVVPDGLLSPVPAASGALVRGVPAARPASTGGAGGSGASAAQVIDLTLELGEGISERVRIEIDEAGRATARAAGAGTGGMR